MPDVKARVEDSQGNFAEKIATVQIMQQSGFDERLEGVVNSMATVPHGQRWDTGIVEMRNASIVVEGILHARPPADIHFVGQDHTTYQGGAHNPQTDIGLWADHTGQLDFLGRPVVGWNDTGFDSTWRPTDELMLAPHSLDPMNKAFTPYSMGSPVPMLGPWPVEVANLTRDVNIRGEPGAFIHLHMHSDMPPINFSYVGIRHSGAPGKFGRYGNHFHQMRAATAGFVSRGVVIRDGGQNGIWPHGCDDMLFEDYVVYHTRSTGAGWDEVKGTDWRDHASNGIHYNRCLFAEGWHTGGNPNTNAILLERGERNKVTNCRIVGYHGPAGHWPSGGTSLPSVWEFSGNRIHHTTGGDGAWFYWQNQSQKDELFDIEGVVGTKAVHAGAYVAANKKFHVGYLAHYDVALQQHFSAPQTAGPDAWEDGYSLVYQGKPGKIEHCGRAIEFKRHNRARGIPALYRNIDIGSPTNQIKVNVDNRSQTTDGGFGGRYDLVDCNFLPSQVAFESVGPGTTLRIQQGSQAWQINDERVIRTRPVFYREGQTQVDMSGLPS